MQREWYHKILSKEMDVLYGAGVAHKVGDSAASRLLADPLVDTTLSYRAGRGIQPQVA